MATGIMIIGPSASGKTTLGKKVAELLGFPYFDVDDFIWRFDTPEPYTVMYSREEKISRLQNAIAPYEYFVMAGSMSSFHQAFDNTFEMMVFLYVDPDIRVQRANERAIQRFGNRVLEGGDMYESNQDFLRKVRQYETDGSPNLSEQKAWMESLTCKKLELDGTEPIEKNARVIAEAWNNRGITIWPLSPTVTRLS